MSLKIEVEVPFAVVNDNCAPGYLKSALAAIGYAPTGSVATPPLVVADQTERNPAGGGGTMLFTDTSSTPKRERGKPAPGRARRTKEEIAEDEAAEKADGATQPARALISTGEERIDSNQVDDEATANQDAEDEAAEVAATRTAPVTIDDVKETVNKYVEKFGLPATQEDGPKIFVEALGNPPAGEAFWKFSILPNDPEKLAHVKAVWARCIAENPLKRELL